MFGIILLSFPAFSIALAVTRHMCSLKVPLGLKVTSRYFTVRFGSMSIPLSLKEVTFLICFLRRIVAYVLCSAIWRWFSRIHRLKHCRFTFLWAISFTFVSAAISIARSSTKRICKVSSSLRWVLRHTLNSRARNWIDKSNLRQINANARYLNTFLIMHSS